MPSKTQLKQQRKQAKIDALAATNSSPVLTIGIIQTILLVTDILWVIELLKEQILSGKRIEQEAQDLLCRASAEIRQALSQALLQRCTELEGDPSQARRRAFFFHFAKSLQKLSNRQAPTKALDEMLAERDFDGIVRLTLSQIIDHDGQRELTEFASRYPIEAENLAEVLRKAANGENERVGPRKANFIRHLAARIEDKARLVIYQDSADGISVRSKPNPLVQSGAGMHPTKPAQGSPNDNELVPFDEAESVSENIDPHTLAKTIVGERYLTDNMKVGYCQLFTAKPHLLPEVLDNIYQLTEPDAQKADALHRGGEPEDVRQASIIRKRVHFLREVLGRLFTAAAEGGATREEKKALADPFPVKEPGSQAA